MTYKLRTKLINLLKKKGYYDLVKCTFDGEVVNITSVDNWEQSFVSVIDGMIDIVEASKCFDDFLVNLNTEATENDN